MASIIERIIKLYLFIPLFTAIVTCDDNERIFGVNPSKNNLIDLITAKSSSLCSNLKKINSAKIKALQYESIKINQMDLELIHPHLYSHLYNYLNSELQIITNSIESMLVGVLLINLNADLDKRTANFVVNNIFNFNESLIKSFNNISMFEFYLYNGNFNREDKRFKFFLEFFRNFNNNNFGEKILFSKEEKLILMSFKKN